MEVEKASSKSGGFFKIFDWGKKPKRKLFASSPASGEYLSKHIHLGSFTIKNHYLPL
jgi:hypothetical protein